MKRLLLVALLLSACTDPSMDAIRCEQWSGPCPQARWVQCVEDAHDSPIAGDAAYQRCDELYGGPE